MFPASKYEFFAKHGAFFVEHVKTENWVKLNCLAKKCIFEYSKFRYTNR